MKHFGFLFLLALLSDLQAAQGRLETLDGQIYHGQIRIAQSGVIIANAAEEYVREVALTNVMQISFDPRPNSEPLSEPTFLENPSKALPVPWQSGEIGSRSDLIGDNAEYLADVFTINRAVANSQSEGNSLQFVYQPMVGNCEIVARVVSIQRKDSEALAGLMIRESLKPDARHVMVGLTGNRGGVFQWQEEPGESAGGKLDPAMRLWYWLRLKRLENTFTGYKSRNGRDWGLIQTVNVPMKEKVFVGLTLITRDEMRPVSARFDKLRTGEFLLDETLVPKVELLGGSVIAGHIELADDSGINFLDNAALARVPTSSATRIVFRWLSPKMEDAVRNGKAGVMLTNGDFVEGDFKGFRKGHVTVSSVLFGIRSFDVFDEVAAVILRRTSAAPFHYEVETWNKTLLRVDSVQSGMGEFVIRDKVLGSVHLPAEEISDLRLSRTFGELLSAVR